MTGEWTEFVYRDFHDFPRAVVLWWRGRCFLLDCQFDYDADDFEPDFAIYELPAEVAALVDEVSWTDLGHRGQLVGSVHTADVEFDPTRRKSVNPDFLEQLVGE